MAGVFKGAADGLDDGVVGVRGGVDEVGVLAACFADYARVPAVGARGDVIGYCGIKGAEDGGAACIVQGGEVWVGEHAAGYFFGVSWEELDHGGGEPGFEEDTVDDGVGGDSAGGRFPNHDVAHQGRGAGEVAAYSGEVEGGDGVHEAFQRTVLDTIPDAGRVVDGLLGVEVLCVLHVEAEEVTQLRCGVDFRLPGVFALA